MHMLDPTHFNLPISGPNFTITLFVPKLKRYKQSEISLVITHVVSNKKNFREIGP